MRYLVIEKFRMGPGPIYERSALQGRMLPDGLSFIDSWIVDDGRYDTCYQLMETHDASLFEAWIERWRDLIDFTVVPVISSGEVAERIA
jgi:hypothetical protein